MIKLKIPSKPFSEEEYKDLEKYLHSYLHQGKSIEMTMTKKSGDERLAITLVFHISGAGISPRLRTVLSGSTYDFNIGEFSKGTIYEPCLLPTKNYELFCETWEKEVIPEIEDRLYYILGMKKEVYKLEVVSRTELKKFLTLT